MATADPSDDDGNYEAVNNLFEEPTVEVNVSEKTVECNDLSGINIQKEANIVLVSVLEGGARDGGILAGNLPVLITDCEFGI